MLSQTHRVIAVLEHALAGQNVSPGRRLRSERDLAMALGVGRRQVNEALSHLAHRGVLSRTRGSGTYVTSRLDVPDDRVGELQAAWDESGLGSTEEVFVPDHAATGATTLKRAGAPLRLCLCGDWLDASPIHQATIERMIATVQRLGHVLSIVSVLDESGRPLPTSVLRQRLRADPADGYLVVYRWGDLFLRAAEGAMRPTIFCGAICGIRHEPAVGVCQHDATPRALRKLSEAGFTRIAMLGYHHPANPIEPQQDAYERAAAALGLSYRHCELVRLGDVRAGAAVRRLLETQHRPDAIFLSDEFLAPALIDAADTLGIVFGRDMGIICFNNRGISDLPASWSRLEVDIHLAGQLAVETLVRTLESGEEYASNLLIQPRWRLRTTHIYPPGSAEPDTAVTSARERSTSGA